MTTMSDRVTTAEGRRSTLQDVRALLTRKGLCRSPDQQLLGGVCAGLGARLGLAPWTARLLFVLVLMLLPGSQLVVYPVLWFLLPVGQAPTVGDRRLL